MADEIYISKEKLEELKEEFEHLRSEKRKEITEALKYAKSLGDLSENAEYHEAREAQAKLEARIRKLEHIIKNAVVVKARHSDTVGVGSTVEVMKGKKDSDKKTYEIVGPEDSDMSAGKISNESPLGEALLDKKKGDTFKFETPGGEVTYTIVDIK